ncbi:MAG: bifunctional adenosylcobinamide kinase/adenosylcobinamide-phosphate guanylyltransferase [Bilophila sp.]
MNACTHDVERNNLTLILGGTRSGKSAYAEKRVLAYEKEAQESGKDQCGVLYVATAEVYPDDASMLDRIKRHQQRRPLHWETQECPLRLAACLSKRLHERATSLPAVIMVDCVTLWVSNILFSLPEPEDTHAFEAAIRAELTALTDLVAQFPCKWVLVSGETGLGLVAPDAIGRVYCDGLGLANQQLAASAHEVMLVVAGRALLLPA